MKATLTTKQAIKVFNILLRLNRFTEEDYIQCVNVLSDSKESYKVVLKLFDEFGDWSFFVGNEFYDTVFDNTAIGGKLEKNIYEELVEFIENTKE